MKKIIIAAWLAAGMFGAGAAQSAVGVSADIGTTGVGAHLTVPLQSQLNSRFGFNYLDYSYSGSSSSVDYNFKMKLSTFDALLDWYPTTTGFRLTGGLVYNGNKITASAKPNAGGTYTFNGNTYTAAQAGKVDGKVDFRTVAPYLGIGWGNAVADDKGWGLLSDLGVMFQGSANTALSNSGCSASAQICSRLASDLAAENSKFDDKVNKFKLYPVLRVGVSYKF